MIKKTLFAASLLVLTSTASAYSSVYPYLGAGLGITANTATSQTYGSYRGVPFNVFAGFGGLVYQNFFLAGELTATLGTAEISNHGAVQTNYGFGASLLSGFEFCDHTLIFARAGVVNTRFSRVRVPDDSIRTNATGGEFGLGMQTALTPTIDIRGEYDFIAYRSISAGSYSAKPRSDVATASLIYKFA